MGSVNPQPTKKEVLDSKHGQTSIQKFIYKAVPSGSLMDAIKKKIRTYKTDYKTVKDIIKDSKAVAKEFKGTVSQEVLEKRIFNLALQAQIKKVRRNLSQNSRKTVNRDMSYFNGPGDGASQPLTGFAGTVNKAAPIHDADKINTGFAGQSGGKASAKSSNSSISIQDNKPSGSHRQFFNLN